MNTSRVIELLIWIHIWCNVSYSEIQNLCLELNGSIEIKYIKYQRYIKNILYKYTDFVLEIIKSTERCIKIMYAKFQTASVV
jgi:hypothetical protein